MDRWCTDHTHPIFDLPLPFNSGETANPLLTRSFGRRFRRYATPPHSLGPSRRVLGRCGTKRLQRDSRFALHDIASHLGFLRETRSSMENRRRDSRLWCRGDDLGLRIHRFDLCEHPGQTTIRMATRAHLGYHHVAEFHGVVVVGWIWDGLASRRHGRCREDAQKGREAGAET